MTDIMLFLFIIGLLLVDVTHTQQENKDDCFQGCECRADPKLTVDCTARGLKAFPSNNKMINDSRTSFSSQAVSLLLQRNMITQVDLYFLNAFPKLQSLSLRANNIRSVLKGPDGTVPPVFGTTLSDLEQLDLSQNHLHVLHSYVLAGFPAMKFLNLSSNAIHTVSANAFNLPNLETLDLSHNQLEVIGMHFFETSPKLNEVYLTGNKVSRLNDRTFGLLANLAILDLSHNQLMRIEEDVFVGMNITYLDLGYNSLRKVPSDSLVKLSYSQTLVLDGNPFHVLEQNSFRGIRVEFISVSRCPSLARIEDGAIVSLPNLRTLTLNHNPLLSYVFPGAVSDCDHLVALDLSSNGLFALESAVVQNLPSLKALYLSGNKFKCHCSLNWIKDADFPTVRDLDRVRCHPGSDPKLFHDESVPASQLDRLTRQCEPYILPLFPTSQTEVMGNNASWLCKALGSGDLALMWRLPQRSAIVGNGECLGRACVYNNVLTVKYLHPEDSGRYGCVAKNSYGQDQRQLHLSVKREHIQIFPITVASTFVTLSWNTSGILSTGRGYILRVKMEANDEAVIRKDKEFPASWQQFKNDPIQAGHNTLKVVKQYEDIEVGMKMNSYTVNGLKPGQSYVFELCLRKEEYIIPISHATLTTRGSGYESDLGIKTDYVSLFAVTIVLSGLITTCLVMSILRMVRFHHVFYHKNAGDSVSQREMIVSPSDHSTVTNNSCAPVNVNNSSGSSSVVTNSICNRSVLSGDQSRLVENEVTSPVDETVA